MLPEGDDPRVREAAARIAALGLAQVRLLDAADAVPPGLAQRLVERRPDKFSSLAAAADALAEPILLGACMVAAGLADAMVAGAAAPTGDVIRAALLAVGPGPGVTTVSSAFYMVRDDTVLTFTDGAVVPDPSAEQLAEIALAAARDRVRIVGDEPRVAFLSYSTKGSAEGAAVEKVRRALARFRTLAPDVGVRRGAPGRRRAGRGRGAPQGARLPRRGAGERARIPRS